jgi:hypothetical protein
MVNKNVSATMFPSLPKALIMYFCFSICDCHWMQMAIVVYNISGSQVSSTCSNISDPTPFPWRAVVPLTSCLQTFVWILARGRSRPGRPCPGGQIAMRD